MVILIGVDLSKPNECLSSLRKWLFLISEKLSSFKKKLDRSNNADSLSAVAEATESATEESPFSQYPIVVTVLKSDVLQVGG